MSLQAEQPRVEQLSAAELADLEAYAAALADRSASALPFAEPTIAQRLACARVELVEHLGLRERAQEIVLVDLTTPFTVTRIDAQGRLARVIYGRDGSEQPKQPEDLEGRGVIVAGSLAMLHEAATLLQELGPQTERLALVATHAPLLPAAHRYLEQRVGAPLLAGVADPRGGWLAVAREPGGPLEGVRGGARLGAIDDEGKLGEGAGVLGVEREGGEVEALSAWVCAQRRVDGHVSFELGVPPMPLDGVPLELPALHELMRTLPLFDYQIAIDEVLNPALWCSPMPGVEGAAQRIEAALERVEGTFVVLGEPGDAGDGPVRSARSMLRRQVSAIWAGTEGSASRRAAWREALFVAGHPGRTVRLLDGATGEALGGELGELVERMEEIIAQREPFDVMLGGVELDWEVRVGDPSAAGDDASGAWITLLPGDDTHEAMLIAGVEARDVAAVRALFESGETSEVLGELMFEGVSLQAYSRPMLARGREHAKDARPLWVDESRCVSSGDCTRVCPTNAIEMRGEPARPVLDATACINCHLCVERCDTAALRPVAGGDIMQPHLLAREALHVRRARERQAPRALTGKLVETPRHVQAPALIKQKPTVVLGLATVTLMEHTAALLVDGELVCAIEEERLVRERHYNWRHPERPGTSLSSDLCLSVEEAWPPRAIEAALRTAGLRMEDVDMVALNGIPARFLASFSGGWNWRPPPVLRANSLTFVPHHMSHAASVYGLSDLDDAWILSVDGRGDYETATVWRAEGHDLQIVDAVPWFPDCSFGGVYETFTRALGFGSHGQGSTMALAALGEAKVDVSSCMSLDDAGRPVLSERVADALTKPYERGYDDPIEDRHKDLAASIQLALETTVGDYLAHHAGDLSGKNLALCGGVALNCRMNGVLRQRFAPAHMHVPPGANDAGTAIGAALIGHRELTGELPRLGLGHTHFGPQWSDDAIAGALKRMRVPFQRLRDVGEQTAELLAQGRIVCWFQGPMEFGPRALGGRSITADPRREDLKQRLNTMKSRQSWRPFGPSILAGRQGEWFEQDWDSRYMLFAVDVRPDKREQVPVVVHFDGSTRPQVVHAEHQPRYHALISAFERRTGVPMIVNTSFNRGGEPIVCNPAEAMRSFVGLGADAIVLGDCLVRREMLRRR